MPFTVGRAVIHVAAQDTTGGLTLRTAYQTKRGRASVGDGLDLLNSLKPKSVKLLLTSPPFALTREKAYGNKTSREYVRWFLPFARAVHEVLADDGSFVIDLGGSWQSGKPIKNVYQYELLLELLRGREARYVLAQEFFWLNRARLPSPVEWVNVRRIRVTDAVNVVWWLSKSESPYADNTQVLMPYSRAMLQLLKKGYNHGRRPSEWNIGKSSFRRNNGGSIPKNYLATGDEVMGYPSLMPTNLLAGANTASRDPYLRACKELGIKAHPARFPRAFADFFIKFLTKPGDLVVDPFAGSNTTGWAAQALKRRWMVSDVNPTYIGASAARFGREPAPILRRLKVATEVSERRSLRRPA